MAESGTDFPEAFDIKREKSYNMIEKVIAVPWKGEHFLRVKKHKKKEILWKEN